MMLLMKKRSILSILSCLSFISLIALQVPVGAHGNNYVPHLLKGKHQRVCDAAAASTAGCFARVETDKSNNPAVTTLPAGYGPAQFHGAYQTPSTSLNPGTIAVVAAYDAPNIVSDLATYNKTFGLPAFPTCSASVTTACFQKVNQNGGTAYPQRNSGWALEISMDVEMAHQTCQNCKLILVEATSASYTNLMKAVDRARLAAAGTEGEDAALARFRSALEPEWSHRDGVASRCKGAAADEATLDAIERLRYAEEHAVRREAGELAPLRRRVQGIIDRELSPCPNGLPCQGLGAPGSKAEETR